MMPKGIEQSKSIEQSKAEQVFQTETQILRQLALKAPGIQAWCMALQAIGWVLRCVISTFSTDEKSSFI